MEIIPLIFVVEDDPITTLIIKRTLAKVAVFEAVQAFPNAYDAWTALELAVANNGPLPNVILLDLNMPVMDGWTFIDKAHAAPVMDQIPLVIMSSSIDPTDLLRSKTYKNVKCFFDKPISEGIVKRIVQVLAGI